MQLESSKLLAEKKPLLRKLLERLLSEYSYASVLACDCEQKSYGISKNGTFIGANDFLNEVGYVIKAYDGESYGEYGFNELNADNLDEIVAAVKDHLMPWKDALAKGLSVKRYPRLAEEKTVFEKSTQCKINPKTVGDDKLIESVIKLREKVFGSDENILDCQVRYQYQIYHKLFLSPDKDMTQNVMWSDAFMLAMAGRGEKVETAFKASSVCGGFEMMDDMEKLIPALLDTLKALLVSEPITPGEYDCICAPDVTGMIVHEAFGHGVEMDMFVKKRALAEQYIGEYVASPLVTMHDGAAVGNQTATFFFDDEGTVAQDTVVIEKGILKRGICDAQAGMALGCAPTGNGRRQNMDHKAYTRMTILFLKKERTSLRT